MYIGLGGLIVILLVVIIFFRLR